MSVLLMNFRSKLARPFLSNALIAGSCAGLGDYITQTASSKGTFDTRRNFAFAFFGAFWSTPYFLVYKALAVKFPGQVLKGALISSFWWDIPVTLPCYFMITDTLRGRDIPFVMEHMTRDYVACAMSSVCIWLPSTLVNLRFIPLQYRIVYDSFVTVVSSMVTSFLSNREVRKWRQESTMAGFETLSARFIAEMVSVILLIFVL